jgi:hypothetical protein
MELVTAILWLFVIVVARSCVSRRDGGPAYVFAGCAVFYAVVYTVENGLRPEGIWGCITAFVLVAVGYAGNHLHERPMRQKPERK